MTMIWLRLVGDAVRHRRYWPALWQAHRAVRNADAALARFGREQPIRWPYGKIDSK